MGAVLETGDTSTTRTIPQSNFMNPFDSIVILFSFRYNTCPSCFPQTLSKIDFSPFIAMLSHETFDNEQVEK